MKNKFTILFFFVFLSCASIFSQSFTIAVIPDTQNYSYYKRQKSLTYPINNADIWYRQMEYIAANSVSKGGFIDFAVHVGDLTESSRKGVASEWEIADKAMSILDGVVPYVVVPGNHDYDAWVYDDNKKFHHLEGGAQFIEHFGPESSHFKDKDFYMDYTKDGLSSCAKFKTKEIEILVFAFEIEPDDDTLKWAQNIIDNNKNLPVIIVTHEFVSMRYEVTKPGTIAYSMDNLRGKVGGNTPQRMWNKFIKKNNQIFMVLCGHEFIGTEGESARTDINDFGYPVYEMMSNFQGRKEIPERNGIKEKDCGDGWFRLLEFDLEKKVIRVKTYSTEYNRFETDRDSQFTIKLDWDWNERFQAKKD